MKKLSLLPIIILLSCSDIDLDSVGSVQSQIITSTNVGDDFQIQVFVPEVSDGTSLPVAFLTDGNWYFEDVADEISELIERNEINPVILVGIGYTGNIDEKRFRDYTFTKDGSYGITTGRASNYSSFLREELVPLIESEYSTDSTDYILMGHSLGGLNVLYNLLQFPSSTFSGFVAISSSIWWDDARLFALEEEFDSQSLNSNTNVYMSWGEDESPSMTILNSEMAERLNERSSGGFEVFSETFDGASHNQTPLAGFINGLISTLN